jgi:hypothetical protein
MIMVAAWAMVLALPAQALGANVSANCGVGGASFVTRGTADNWQDHTHDGILWHTWYFGRQFKAHDWGFETGLETGTVNGPNLANPSAICLA